MDIGIRLVISVVRMVIGKVLRMVRMAIKRTKNKKKYFESRLVGFPLFL